MAHPRTAEMLSALAAESLETWFDLGLLIDRLREDREVPWPRARGDFEAFKRDIAGGIAFVTFEYGVDGVSMEIAKYARALSALLPDVRLHYVAGSFPGQTDGIIDPKADWHRVPGMNGFDRWPLYRSFFGRKLKRGSPLYNQLIGDFWTAVLELCEHLGGIVEEHDIRLLYTVNVNSNPGNPALALATVLVSEYLRIPVINNCHDFFWDGGYSEIGREALGIPRGQRDHFFTNAHVGEIFSLIEVKFI